MVKMTDRAFEGKHDIIDRLLNMPPRGYVFLVTATQDSHYDLFMLTLIREALSQSLSTLQIITEARNRAVMKDLASLQRVTSSESWRSVTDRILSETILALLISMRST